MAPLRLWAWIAVVCLTSGTLTWAQEIDLIPQVQKGVAEFPPRTHREAIDRLELLADPERPVKPPALKHRIPKFSGNIKIIGGENRPPADSAERELGTRVYDVSDLVIPLASGSPLQAANAQRQQLIDSLQALQDTYCRNAQLDEALAVRNMIRQLKQQAEQAQRLPEPVVAQAPAAPQESSDVGLLRGQNNVTFYRTVTGTTQGNIWGGAGGVYTDDSLLAMAAVHAGVLKEGDTAVVRFTILPGQESHPSLTRHGVSSSSWQSWGGSYRIEGAAKEISSVYELRGQDVPPFAVYVVGRLDGRVWGSGSYTDDSDLGTAAVHAGLLKPGEAGFVTVTLEGGKAAYESSTQNGVTSRPYRSWEAGFRLSRFQPIVDLQRLRPGNSFTLDVF